MLRCMPRPRWQRKTQPRTPASWPKLTANQAALLWRCAALFEDGLIEQSGFKQLFANLVATTREEAKELQESYGLQRLIAASGAIQNDEMVNIQEFVTYHYVHTGSDPPLEDESWDYELVRQFVKSRHQDQKANAPSKVSSPLVAMLLAEQESRAQSAAIISENTNMTPSWISLKRESRPSQVKSLPVGMELALDEMVFVLGESIGQGGFGNVYKAFRKTQDSTASGEQDSTASSEPYESRLYAIEIASNSQTAFAVEAVAASQVRDMAQQVSYWHGRVFLPLVHGVGIGCAASHHEMMQNPAMLVMQLADGTLEGRKFEGEALEMVAWALASTLALLNASGFIHGDLKPSNVLWQVCDTKFADMFPGLEGWPLLSDFGSAQAFSTMNPDHTSLNLNDKIRAGGWTKSYAAPEVISCRGHWQTIRSDMFSWARTIRAVSKHPRKLPPTLHKLCQACTIAHPEGRPVSFKEIANLIEVASPACLHWGRMLWKEQQTCFKSVAHAQHLSSCLCMQGLQVLLSQRRQMSVDHESESNTLELLAQQYSRIGNHIDAVALLQEAVKVDPARAVFSGILGILGNAYGAIGDAAKQRELLERALKIKEAFFGKDHMEVAITLVNLGNAYGALGDAARQRDLLDSALQIEEAYFGEEHWEVEMDLGFHHVRSQLSSTSKSQLPTFNQLKQLAGLEGE